MTSLEWAVSDYNKVMSKAREEGKAKEGFSECLMYVLAKSWDVQVDDIANVVFGIEEIDEVAKRYE